MKNNQTLQMYSSQEDILLTANLYYMYSWEPKCVLLSEVHFFYFFALFYVLKQSNHKNNFFYCLF